MAFGFINRLFGRTDTSIDAVNAYVEGNASADDVKLVEQLMRDNPALEKDLATQKVLLDVLSKVEKVEAPRSFAITPEMVAVAARSDSAISRLAEMFGPQRKLAFAPAIVAGIAALSVALLTLGDLTGVVDQADLDGRDDAATAAAVMESATEGGSIGLAGEPGEPTTPGAPAAGSAPELEMAVQAERGGAGSGATATAAPAATSAPAATMIVQESAKSALDTDDIVTESAAESGLAVDEPTSLAAADSVVLEMAGDEIEQPFGDDPPAEIGVGGSIDAGEEAVITAGAGGEADVGIAAGAGDGALAGALEGAGSGFAAGAGDGAFEGAFDGVGEGAARGISLPLWQLQLALAALAIVAIGVWAGLRRIRGE
ncbi:MAG: hypothetical protein V3T49_02175 [Dehalococcoidia bacterium]